MKIKRLGFPESKLSRNWCKIIAETLIVVRPLLCSEIDLPFIV